MIDQRHRRTRKEEENTDEQTKKNSGRNGDGEGTMPLLLKEIPVETD